MPNNWVLGIWVTVIIVQVWGKYMTTSTWTLRVRLTRNIRQDMANEPPLLSGEAAREFLAHGRNATATGALQCR